MQTAAASAAIPVNPNIRRGFSKSEPAVDPGEGF
jgi:hypothetical protein